MKIDLELTDQEVAALEMLARGRQIRIVAGSAQAAPEDRAIAKLLEAAHRALEAQP